MNLTKKTSILGMSSLLLMMSISGCGKKPVPHQVNNNYVSGAELSVGYDNNGHFKNIDNKNSKGFKLNNYNPQGFKTSPQSFKGYSSASCLFSYKTNDMSKYQVIAPDGSTSEIVAGNVGMGLISFGIIPLIFGGICNNKLYFDYKQFDKDAKKWVDENNIDREVLISEYSTLVQLVKDKNEEIHKISVNTNNVYLTEQEKRKNKYVSNSPILVKKYVDKSGLYKKEKLPVGVDIILTEIEEKHFNNTIKTDSYHVYSTFPCAGMKECLAKMDKAKENIDTNHVPNIAKVKANASKWLKSSKEQLVKETSQYKLDFSDKDLVATLGDKTINYKIKTQSVVKAGKKAKKVKVVYEIKSFAYKNVLPSFYNTNKDIAINFDSKTHKITLVNMTDEYILIKSIDLYYNGEIIKLGESKQKNYSSELSPQSESKFSMSRYIEKSNYMNVTKRTALKTSVEFGFSIRYSLGDSTKNKTLYKTKSQSLYSLVSKL